MTTKFLFMVSKALITGTRHCLCVIFVSVMFPALAVILSADVVVALVALFIVVCATAESVKLFPDQLPPLLKTGSPQASPYAGLTTKYSVYSIKRTGV